MLGVIVGLGVKMDGSLDGSTRGFAGRLEIIEGAGRRLAAGDVLVLVRRGDRFVHALSRGLTDAGVQVLDIGCGAGATTLAMAGRLGPGGACLGIDISRPLVEAAARRAAVAGVAGAHFLAADAQTHDFEPAAFDAAISRVGSLTWSRGS